MAVHHKDFIIGSIHLGKKRSDAIIDERRSNYGRHDNGNLRVQGVKSLKVHGFKFKGSQKGPRSPISAKILTISAGDGLRDSSVKRFLYHLQARIQS
jgi:hypothetical protein